MDKLNVIKNKSVQISLDGTRQASQQGEASSSSTASAAENIARQLPVATIQAATQQATSPQAVAATAQQQEGTDNFLSFLSDAKEYMSHDQTLHHMHNTTYSTSATNTHTAFTTGVGLSQPSTMVPPPARVGAQNTPRAMPPPPRLHVPPQVYGWPQHRPMMPPQAASRNPASTIQPPSFSSTPQHRPLPPAPNLPTTEDMENLLAVNNAARRQATDNPPPDDPDSKPAAKAFKE